MIVFIEGQWSFVGSYFLLNHSSSKHDVVSIVEGDHIVRLFVRTKEAVLFDRVSAFFVLRAFLTQSDLSVKIGLFRLTP